jgi:hypothetical protein
VSTRGPRDRPPPPSVHFLLTKLAGRDAVPRPELARLAAVLHLELATQSSREADDGDQSLLPLLLRGRVLHPRPRDHQLPRTTRGGRRRHESAAEVSGVCSQRRT